MIEGRGSKSPPSCQIGLKTTLTNLHEKKALPFNETCFSIDNRATNAIIFPERYIFY